MGKGVEPKRIYPLVQDFAASGVPIAVTCGVLGFSRQAFHKWKRNPFSHRELEEAYLVDAILQIHVENPGFGHRFIAAELVKIGFQVSERRVWRLCKEHQIWAHFAKKQAKRSKPGPAVHGDLIRRQFKADRPNKVWCTDITEHRTREGILYLAAVMDLFSNRIVGYSIDKHRDESLVIEALTDAVKSRDPKGTIVHSDRGSQFRSTNYQTTLEANGLKGSMGRVAACADNAAMESFFGLLQNNVLDLKTWITREELELEIFKWLELTYHRKRGKKRLGGQTPIEYEMIQAALQAA